MNERFIEVMLVEMFTTDCDGCGRTIAIGEPALTGIESCCGQCTRTLCADCVRSAYEQLVPLPARVDGAEQP